MHILYLSMSYDVQGEGLYQDLVNELLHRGHFVTVARGDYKIDKSFYSEESNQLGILNVKIFNPFEKNLFKKGLNQIRMNHFFANAIRKFLSKEHFEIVLYATPPVTLGGVIRYCKRKFHASSFLMLKDIFPQNAVDLNMIKKGSIIYRFFRMQEVNYYKCSDYIGCMSKKNRNYLLKHNANIDERKVVIFPNSINLGEKRPAFFNENRTVFLFGGNLGKPQNVGLILDIAKRLQKYNKAEFVIIGKGTEQSVVQDFCSLYKLENLHYYNQMSQPEFESVLHHADVGVISLDPRFTIPNVPSRLQTYLKLQKPILALTDTVTDIREMILENDCGWWVNASKVDEIVATIYKICENKNDQKMKGARGYEFLAREFDVKNNVDILENILSN